MSNINLHPIESLMKTSMENIKQMIEVNTVIGDAIETSEGTIIMPITKASFGFVAGGAEYCIFKKDNTVKEDDEDNRYPFGGGSGAGISVQPVAFMVIEENEVKLLHVHHNFGNSFKIIEEIPNIINQIGNYINSNIKSKKIVEKISEEN
ncbi:GerW family sporulation protein [Defluviitalea phaphyphila]|uniref:GerW family sporulation protein n=1 Tax=Defluviitalea phaphyphila TaxID=1473580 RepID=UPI0011875727|nr:GerW family sporulation protein [Defluviitalea phaphyphila]